MNDRAWVATRKGLFELHRRGPTWSIAENRLNCPGVIRTLFSLTSSRSTPPIVLSKSATLPED